MTTIQEFITENAGYYVPELTAIGRRIIARRYSHDFTIRTDKQTLAERGIHYMTSSYIDYSTANNYSELHSIGYRLTAEDCDDIIQDTLIHVMYDDTVRLKSLDHVIPYYIRRIKNAVRFTAITHARHNSKHTNIELLAAFLQAPHSTEREAIGHIQLQGMIQALQEYRYNGLPIGYYLLTDRFIPLSRRGRERAVKGLRDVLTAMAG